MQKYRLFDLPFFEDERGETVPFEIDESFPIPVKRIYFVTGNEGAVRGGHAHETEEEVFIAISGTVTAVLNDGSGDTEIELNSKQKALYVGTQCWHELKDFSSDCVVLCLSSTHYDGRAGYIENKAAFLNSV